MMKPTIHLNGTAAIDLNEGYEIALNGIRAAIEALQASAPNARDYYVQGHGAFASAVREHEARMHKLADVAHELNELMNHTLDAMQEQQKRRTR